MKRCKSRSSSLAGLLLGLSGSAWAGVPPEGEWIGSPLTEHWTLGTWGEACGPTPQAQGVRGGAVQLSKQGAELVFSGAGRTFSTAGCWESYPGLNRVEHSAGANAWNTVCKTAPADPRRATVRTTVTATDEQIVLAESGAYEFALQGSVCNARVERRRTFTRAPVAAAPANAPANAPAAEAPGPASPGLLVGGAAAVGGAPAAASTQEAAPPAATVQPEAPASSCKSPGPIASLRIEPSVGWVRPGAQFDLRIDARDAAGCSIGKPRLTWQFEPPGSLSFRSAKRLRVAADAAEGPVRIVARQDQVVARTDLEVVSDARYRTLLTPEAFSAAPLAASAAASAAALSQELSVMAAPAVASDGGSRRKWLFALCGLLVSGVVAGLGLALLRQGGTSTRRTRKAAAATAGGAPTRVCPACGATYGDDLQFCGRDGTPLVLRSEAT